MRWFDDLRLKAKLMLGYALVAILTLAIGGLGLYSLTVEDARFERVNTKHFEGASLLADAGIQFNRMRTLTAQSMLANGPEEVREFKSTYDELATQLERDLGEARERLTSAASRERLAEAERAYQTWKTGNEDAWRLSLAGRTSEGHAELIRNKTNAMAANEGLESILEQKHQLMAQEARDQDREFARTRGVMIGFAALALVLSVMLGLFIAGVVERPVTRGMHLMETVATGDFTQRLGLVSHDEIGRLGRAMDETVARMSAAITEVAHSARTVSESAGQLTSASSSISSGAQEQASSLEQTAASLEEITSTVKRNADNSQQAARLAQGARDVARQGGEVVGRAVRAMSEINASSKRIAEIIIAIDEIAFQTNLLALNAAVEAARAGEQGRGFAVVASEVRNLAQRSAASAREIKSLIQDSVSKVETGSELVNQSGHTLEEIVTSVQHVAEIVSEIAAASREQSGGIEQVGKAVAQMDQVTQANAAQTEELASTAEALSAQAGRLTELVGRFRLDGAAAQDGAKRPTTLRVVEGRREPAGAPNPPLATGTDGTFSSY